MISFEEALRLTMEQAVRMPIEQVHLPDSLDRILAETVYADSDMPPFDKSAVDGYACRQADLHSELDVIEMIPAGKVPREQPRIQQCAKIMTGAMVPTGADCVIMVEDTEVTGENRIRFTEKTTQRNICFKGEDIKKGEAVLERGTRIEPQHIAVLAAVGAVRPKVSCKVRVGILSTGDELVEPDQKPDISQIRNSNGAQLMAQVIKAGGNPSYYGISHDNPVVLHRNIEHAMKENDIVILTGGVSMGDFDHVPEVMKELGIEILFKSIAIQPGRPTVFGKKGACRIFGLPGNPVSSFILFEILVKEFMSKMMGLEEEKPGLCLMTGQEFVRKNVSRKGMIPVRIRGQEIFPVVYNGSAHINAYTSADGVIAFELGQSKLEKGVWIDVRQV